MVTPKVRQAFSQQHSGSLSRMIKGAGEMHGGIYPGQIWLLFGVN